MEENANKLHFECTNFNSSMRVTVWWVYLCIYYLVYLQNIWNTYTHEGLVIFFDKMWVALTRASCCVVAFGGSEKSRLVTASASARSDAPLLWCRLVVVAPTRQWLRRWLSAECSTKSQWGAAWGQLCHALQSCKLIPAWDPIQGSRPGSSLGYFKHVNIKSCWWITKIQAIKNAICLRFLSHLQKIWMFNFPR